ncbi:hypothetical protein ACJ41O_012572 [Fusarium nematophilum]
MRLLSFLLAISLAAQAQARAVFAHFMIGNTETDTNTDFLYDMKLAQGAHIDGFVLNIAYDDPVNDRSIPMAFEAASSLGFKLLFSFDYAGNGDWPMDDVIGLISKYGSHAAHFRHDSQPLVSTFEGFKRSGDWKTIKEKTNCYFMPSWSFVGAKRAVRTGATDGLFSWAAWPEGPNKIDMEVDASYLIFLNGSSYMILCLPDSSPTCPNQWPGQPEYLQIISWNDYGESHCIGPLNDKAYVAFDIGKAPYNYVKGMPHDAFRMLLPYAIDTYKNGIATINEEVLVAWYRLTPASACSTGGTTGNTAAQLQPEMAPGELSQDKIFFSAVLTSLLTPRVTIDGQVRIADWDDVPYGVVGMYHGSYAYNGRVGKVLIELVDSNGAVHATLYGAELTKICEKGITNWNPWAGGVYTTRSVSATPALSLSKQQCMKGTGRERFKELCEFTRSFGYCPPGLCTCTKLGKAFTEVDPKNVDGYPLAGSDCTYKGLCAYACNHGFCPEKFCVWNCPYLDCSGPSKLENPVKQRWNSVGAGEFFNYTANWFYYQNEVAIGGNPMFLGTPFYNQYIRSVAYFFGGRDSKGANRAADNYDCDIIGTNACTNPFKCGTTQYPGMDLLFASFSNLHNFITNMYLSVDGVAASASANAATIANTFGDSSLDAGLKFMQEFMEYFGLSMQFAGGSFSSRIITNTEAFAAFGTVIQRTQQLSGTIESFTSLYSTISQAQTEEAVNALEIIKEVSAAGGEFAKQIRKTLDSFLKQIFSGSYLSTRRLYPMIADGTWLDAPKISIFDFHKSIEPIMNAILITKAWISGPNGNAVVILVEEGRLPYPQPRRGNAALMANEDGESTQHFYRDEKGKEWTLWIAQVDVCKQNRCNLRFKAPKGLDAIRDDKKFGVSIENFILSPFFNWQRQGNSNALSRLDPYAKNGDKSATSSVPFSVGLSHPGAIQLPVCNIETAWQNIAKWSKDPTEAPCSYYPCCDYW